MPPAFPGRRNKILEKICEVVPGWKLRQYRDHLKSDSQMRRRLIVMVMGLVMGLLGLYAMFGGKPPVLRVADGSTIKAMLEDAPLVLTDLGGVDCLVTNPKETSLSEATAVVVLFHGCSNDKETWRNGPQEREQIRLLQSRTAHAGNQNLYLIAFSSDSAVTGSGQGSGCWQQTADAKTNPDLKRSKAVIDAIRAKIQGEKEGSKPVPIFALGASSGGSFVSLLASTFPGLVQGLVVYISPLHPVFVSKYMKESDPSAADGAVQNNEATEPSLPPPPPILFVHMKEGDQQTAFFITSQKDEVKQSYLDAPCHSKLPGSSHSQWRCMDELHIRPHTLHGYHSFSDWLPGRITPAASKQLTQALVAAGVLKISSMAAAAAETGVNSNLVPGYAASAATLRSTSNKDPGASSQFKIVSQPRGLDVVEVLSNVIGGSATAKTMEEGDGRGKEKKDEQEDYWSSVLSGALIPLGLAGYFGSHARLPESSSSSSAFSSALISTADDRYLSYPDDVLFGVQGIDDKAVQATFTGPLPPLFNAEIAKGRKELRRWAQELLNEAFAQHEASAQHAENVRSWILTHATAY
jgi:hypothetical protein